MSSGAWMNAKKIAAITKTRFEEMVKTRDDAVAEGMKRRGMMRMGRKTEEQLLIDVTDGVLVKLGARFSAELVALERLHALAAGAEALEKGSQVFVSSDDFFVIKDLAK